MLQKTAKTKSTFRSAYKAYPLFRLITMRVKMTAPAGNAVVRHSDLKTKR